MKNVVDVIWVTGLLLLNGFAACDVFDEAQVPPEVPLLHGVVRDAITGIPVAGIQIESAGGRAATDSGGRFELPALEDVIELSFRDENDADDYGSYFDFHAIFRPDVIDTVTAWMIPNIEMGTDSFPDFLSFLQYMVT